MRQKKITSARTFNLRTIQFKRISRVNNKCENLTEGQTGIFQKSIWGVSDSETEMTRVAHC